MSIGLGIDTGGTYTDAVIYDFDSRKVLESAKSLTTKYDLTVGIRNVLNQLSDEHLENIAMVGLSTTLMPALRINVEDQSLLCGE